MLSNYKVDNKSLIRLFSSAAHRIPQSPGALLTYYFSFFALIPPPHALSSLVASTRGLRHQRERKNIVFSYDISRHL